MEEQEGSPAGRLGTGWETRFIGVRIVGGRERKWLGHQFVGVSQKKHETGDVQR